MAKQSLYDQLGGIFAIAAVVDMFSDAIMDDAVVGRLSKNRQLRAWAETAPERLPGLKWMRTLWVADITGGPYKYVGTQPGENRLALDEAHRKLRISPSEFDRVAEILDRSLRKAKVPPTLRDEVLGAFAAHKNEVTEGYLESS